MTAPTLAPSATPYLTFGALEQFVREVWAIPTLTNEEERRLLCEIAAGERHARDRLVEGYQPMLVALAKRFIRRCTHLELLDLVQEGTLGLLEALQRYAGHSEGTTFRAWALAWARGRMMDAVLQHEGPFLMPIRTAKALRQLGAVQQSLYVTQRREPTVAELASATELSTAQIIQLLILQSQLAPSDATGSATIELLAADRSLMPQSTDPDIKYLYRALDHLTPREQQVIRLRFGLDGDQPLSTRASTELLGTSRAVVERLERQARQRLKVLIEAERAAMVAVA